MRILYLSARFPFPPDRGDRLTGFHLLRTFSRRHEVTLLSFEDGHEPPGGRRELATWCESIQTVHLARARSWAQAWLGIASPTPSQVQYYASRRMRACARSLLAHGSYDAVFVQLMRMAPFVRDVEHPAKVLFLADSMALSLQRSLPFQPWWKRAAVRWEQRRVAAFEPAVARDFRECWVLSRVDQQDLVARGCGNVHVVPHGVDERLFELPLQSTAGPQVTFLGNLSVPHNQDAAVFLVREIWPLVVREQPLARLELVGADPTPLVRALADAPGVTLVGPVPDLVPVWARTRVLVAPLRFSTGIQNKVLEAMAAGVQVVTTPQAAEAIGARHGDELLVGSDAPSLARAVLACLADPDSRERRRRARARVQTGFSWETLCARLESLAGAEAP